MMTMPRSYCRTRCAVMSSATSRTEARGGSSSRIAERHMSFRLWSKQKTCSEAVTTASTCFRGALTFSVGSGSR